MELGEFFSQLPPQFFIVGCGLPILGVISLVGLYFSTRSNVDKKNEVEKAIRRDPVMQSRQEKAASTSTTTESMSAGAEADYDPLAELMQAREEAQDNQTTPAREAPRTAHSTTQNDDEDDEEAVDLASLLAGMGEENEPEQDDIYSLSDKPSPVKLNSGDVTTAVEELAILVDERDKHLVVQVDDMAYRTLVDAPAAKKTFARLMKELSGSILKPDDESVIADVSDDAVPYTVPRDPVTVQLNVGATTSAKVQMIVLRDTTDDHLMVLIRTTAYRTLVDAPKAKKLFKRLMKALSGSVLEPDPSPPQPDESRSSASNIQQTEASEPEPAGETTISEVDESSPESHTAVRQAADDEKPGRLPGALPDFTIDPEDKIYERGRFGRVKAKKVEDEDIPEVNIAEAIGEYLEYKIKQTPKFQGRDIYIKPSYTGGVKIFVGEKSYDFVDEVEDPEVRQFIQNTVQEWQDQN